MTVRKKPGLSEWTRRTAVIVLLTAFVLFNLRVAVYHLSTEGWKSGLVEIGLSLWVMLMTYLAWEGRRRKSSPSWRRSQQAARLWLALISGVYLALSLYHFTHQGVRSGAVETAASLLLLLLCLVLG